VKGGLPLGWIAALVVSFAALDSAAMLLLLACPAKAAGAACFAGLHLASAAGVSLALSRCAPTFGGSALALAATAGLVSAFLPVLGGPGFFAALCVRARASAAAEPDPWQHATLEPAWNNPDWRPGAIARTTDATALAEALAETSSAARRFQAVVRARRLSPRARVSLLRTALRDPSDEVRLFAFSMMEHARDDLQRAVHELGAAVANAPGPAARAQAHRRLAEAHWEFSFLGLAEGAVLDHALDAALEHAQQSCEQNPGDAPAEMLRGRILLQRGDVDEARVAFERALAAGHPPSKVLPYVAECAFRRRDYDRVREHLRELLRVAGEGAPLRPVLELWL
jgi:tetratricopeptide (TPR) repeat protein